MLSKNGKKEEKNEERTRGLIISGRSTQHNYLLNITLSSDSRDAVREPVTNYAPYKRRLDNLL